MRVKTLKSTIGFLIVKFIAKLTSILTTVINKKIAKIEVSFLVWQAMNTWLSNYLFHCNFKRLSDLSLDLAYYIFYPMLQ